MSSTIPVDIINMICEFAAGSNKIWYPTFSPNNHKLIWKRNKFYDCRKKVLKTHFVKFRMYSRISPYYTATMDIINFRTFARCIVLPRSLYFCINHTNHIGIDTIFYCHVFASDNELISGKYFAKSYQEIYDDIEGEIISFYKGNGRNFDYEINCKLNLN